MLPPLSHRSLFLQPLRFVTSRVEGRNPESWCRVPTPAASSPNPPCACRSALPTPHSMGSFRSFRVPGAQHSARFERIQVAVRFWGEELCGPEASVRKSSRCLEQPSSGIQSHRPLSKPFLISSYDFSFIIIVFPQNGKASPLVGRALDQESRAWGSSPSSATSSGYELGKSFRFLYLPPSLLETMTLPSWTQILCISAHAPRGPAF